MDNRTDPMIREIYEAAHKYCANQQRLSLSTLGRIMMNDSKFFDRILRTNNCSIKMYRKAMSWFEERNAGPQKRLKPHHTPRPIPSDTHAVNTV